MGGCTKFDVVFGGFSFVWGRGLATLLLFLYVTKEAGRKCVLDMRWPPAAECNMITNKETVYRSIGLRAHLYESTIDDYRLRVAQGSTGSLL